MVKYTGMKKTWHIALAVFLAAFALYTISAELIQHTDTPRVAYFDELADSFLHGRVCLQEPRSTHDLTYFDGKWYMPFLPLPAFLLLPWVAIAGVENTNTVAFGVMMGAANAALVFLLLQSLAKRGWTKLSLNSNLGLVVLFALGSVHWTMVVQGSVWFLSQICTVTFLLLALWLAVETGSPLLSGAALGLALFGRPHVALVYPLLLAIGIEHLRARGEHSLRPVARWVVLSGIPIAVSVALILGYNALRFDNPLDFGYSKENVNPQLADDLHTYGQFNLRYVPRNFRVMALAMPVWDAKNHLILPDPKGMSLLLTTPALVYLLRARKRSWLVAGAWLALALLLVPLLTYYNTGWRQFGYRFSLDFMPVVMVLLATGAGERVDRKFWALILLGVLVNAWGVWWFQNPRFFQPLLKTGQ